MFCKYKDNAVQRLSFVDTKNGLIPRILLWKSVQVRNPTKSVSANKDAFSRHFSFFEITRILVNEKGTENMKKIPKGN